jgi:plastocyanin
MTRFIRAASAALLILGASYLVASCSKSSSNKATNPPALELNSGDLTGSATYAHTFPAAGAFPYHCVHHGSMTGTITVSASAPPGDKTVSITDNAFNTGSPTILVGAKVTWTNTGSNVHTVTSN